MNLYFIVEGRRTEKKVYPAWLNFLIPELNRVTWSNEAVDNNYYLFNGNGFPALLHNHLKNSIEEVNDLGNYNYLILILDVDETSVQERKIEVQNFILEENLELLACELVVIPQNRCIESWFLGNKNVFKANAQDPILNEYTRYYNVRDNDPELMGVYGSFNTHAQFHADYCTLFLRERNIRYSKNNPNGVTEENYLNSLIDRQQTTESLESFKYFIDFCKLIRDSI